MSLSAASSAVRAEGALAECPLDGQDLQINAI